jgi:hypothetical protein
MTAPGFQYSRGCAICELSERAMPCCAAGRRRACEVGSSDSCTATEVGMTSLASCRKQGMKGATGLWDRRAARACCYIMAASRISPRFEHLLCHRPTFRGRVPLRSTIFLYCDRPQTSRGRASACLATSAGISHANERKPWNKRHPAQLATTTRGQTSPE